MTEIDKGDWVTINGCGPYKVLETVTDSAWLYVQTPYGVGMEVLSDWCVKVPAPWKPEPETLWLDKDRAVWRVAAANSGQALCLDMGGSAWLPVAEVMNLYGPMTQLVPKEQADE